MAKPCPPKPDFSRGYVWPVYDTYDIFRANPDGSGLTRLTTTPGYDAEATISRDGRVVFTSVRDGDMEIYSMNGDGGDVRRLTHRPGPDGGPFFSPDGRQIVFRGRALSPGPELNDYMALLRDGLWRPTSLEIFVMNADGSGLRQVTALGGANFAPYFTPDGARIIFASNHHNPRGRDFELYLVNTDGTGLERVTWNPTFDGFPMFSPDGKHLVFASNRHAKVRGQHERVHGGLELEKDSRTRELEKVEKPRTRETVSIVKLASDLVAIDSVNPSLVPGGAGEGAIGDFLAAWLRRAGFDVERTDVAPGARTSSVSRTAMAAGRLRLLCGHTDTVGVEGMAAPFDPVVRDGRLYGRGSQDMKGGLAAMLHAAVGWLIGGRRGAGRVIVAAVADEEYASLGADAFAARWRADEAVITEPTDLAIGVAHKGFSCAEIVVHGRAAHGSRPRDGRDAIMAMGRVLHRLETLDGLLQSTLRRTRSSASPSLHAGRIHGGTELSVYPARAVLEMETTHAARRAGRCRGQRAPVDRARDCDRSIRTFTATFACCWRDRRTRRRAMPSSSIAWRPPFAPASAKRASRASASGPTRQSSVQQARRPFSLVLAVPVSTRSRSTSSSTICPPARMCFASGSRADKGTGTGRT